MARRIDNIKILHIIKFLSSLYFYHQVITLYFQARGLNYVQINSLWGIIVGTQALAEIPTGIIADRVGRKYSIVAALALQFLGELIFIFADTYLLFVIVCIIAGIGFSFLSGCFEAFMYDSLKTKKKEHEMQKVAGLNGSFALAATLIGSVVGGFITANLQLTGFLHAVILTAFFVFLSFLASLFLKEPQLMNRQHEVSTYRLIKDGTILLKTNRSLRRIIVLSLLATPFVNYLLNFYPPYLVKAHVGGYQLGLTLAFASLLAVFASKYAYLLEKVLGVKTGLSVAVLIPGIFYFLLAFIYHSIVSIILVVFAFASMHIQKPIFSDYLNRRIESRNRATVLSMINVISGLYVAIMGLVIGFLADSSSLNYSFIFMGSVIVIAGLFIKINESHVAAIAGRNLT
jgi:MFS family permease